MTTTTSRTSTSTGATPPVARFAGWAGIGFAATFVAGFITAAQVPAYDAADADWVAWVEEDNALTVIGTFLLTAAGLLLMAFVTSLAAHVRGPLASDSDHEVAILRGAGVVAGTTLMVAALIGGAMSAGVTFASDFEAPGAELLRALDQLSLGLMLVGTGWSMAATVALTSWVGRRSATLPGWLTTAGFVVAAALLLSPMFLPIVFVPLWVLITSITVLRAR